MVNSRHATMSLCAPSGRDTSPARVAPAAPPAPAAPGRAEDPGEERGIARVLSRCIGQEAFGRFFDQRAHLRIDDGALTVEVADAFMASLVGRRFGEALRQTAETVAGPGAPVHICVEAVAHEPVVAPGGRRDSAGMVLRRIGGAVGASGGTRVRAGRLHRLDDFIVGECNRLAFEAAVRMAEAPASEAASMSPLFIHGACGMGKTHLVQGIAERFRRLHPEARIRVETGESFTNAYLAALQTGSIERFRRACRRVDLLVIDDVHFLADKRKTQEELLHTFDAAGMAGARVVLASDEHPGQIRAFSRALMSRFTAGLVARLDSPEPALRESLVKALCARRGLTVDDDAAAAVAASARGPAGKAASVRDIEGLVTKVQAVSRLLATRGHITRLVVDAAMSDAGGSRRIPTPARPIRLEEIIAGVCSSLQVSASEFRGRSRHRRVVLARWISAHLAREMTTASFPDIARAMGRPTHSTIIAACKRLADEIKQGAPSALEGDLAGVLVRDLCERARMAVLQG